MVQRFLNSKEIITDNFLLYSWNELKMNKQKLCDFSKIESSRPISKSWFKRTSYLIQKGSYSYVSIKNIARKNNLNFKSKFLRTLKTKILENAFFLILKFYYFEGSLKSFEDVNLTECVRILIKFSGRKILLLIVLL